MERHIKRKTEEFKEIKFDTLEGLAKRYRITLKSSFYDRTRILKAAEKMDALREKYGSKYKIGSVKMIRKWRSAR